jgi:hypothetical protein
MTSWAYLLLIAPLLLLYRLGTVEWRSRRPPAMPDVPAKLRERLGEALATWLGATRALRARLVMLEDRALTMLAQERNLEDASPLSREIDDANFLVEIREVRKLGQGWLQQAQALDAAARGKLHALGLDVAELASMFDLRWRTDRATERLGNEGLDRSDEITAVIDQCARDAQRLAEIDGRLSAAEPEPYRGQG